MHLPRHRTPRRERGAAALVTGALLATALGVSIAAAPSTAAADPVPIVSNGGLEDGGTAPWTGRTNAVLSLSDDAASGAHSLLVSNRTATSSGALQDLAGRLKPNTSYTVSAKVKYDTGPATRRFWMTSQVTGGRTSTLGGFDVTRGQWTTVNLGFSIGDTVPSSYAIYFETTSASSADVTANPGNHLMDYKLDDVAVTEFPVYAFNRVGKTPGNGNPLISHKFGADPYALEHNGRVYIYMTNDTQEWFPNAANVSASNNYSKINQINVISSDDMVNWTDHGAIQVGGPTGIAQWANNSWAPAAISKVIDGQEKFFLYFANSAGSVGVLTADSPTGPWRDPIGKALINSSTPGASANGNWLFDPAVVIDGSGQGYLYFGGGTGTDPNNPKTTRWIKLGADMVTTVGSAQVIDAPKVFEASHVFERNGKYYYSYSSNFNGTTPLPGYPSTGVIAYLMADSPEGPWTPAQLPALNNGTMFQNTSSTFGVGGNNHQSFFELAGKYYFVYHAQTVNLALVDGVAANTRGFRSPHINEVTFNPDGTMNMVNGDYKGVPQVKDLDPYAPIEAETIAWQSGIATSKITEPSATGNAVNLQVEQINNGDWVALSKVDFGARGAASLTAKVRALSPGTTVEVHADAVDGPTVGTLAVDSAVGQWATVTAGLTGLTGERDVYFVVRGPADAELLNLDSWQFTAAPELAVSAVGGSRCVAGKAMPTVTVTNNANVPVSVTATYGTTVKTFASIAPGSKASHAFTTRLSSIPAGSITVEASAVVDGQPVSVTQQAAYPAATCP